MLEFLAFPMANLVSRDSFHHFDGLCIGNMPFPGDFEVGKFGNFVDVRVDRFKVLVLLFEVHPS
jgi:hypothetical protein